MLSPSSAAAHPELSLLNAKQRAFVLEYMRDSNGTAAARRAGYKGSDKYLGVQASRLIANDRVSRAIAALSAPALKKAEVTAERVINALAEFAFGQPEYDVKGKPVVSARDRISALKALGDHFGIFDGNDARVHAPHLDFPRPDIDPEEARKDLLRHLRQRGVKA